LPPAAPCILCVLFNKDKTELISFPYRKAADKAYVIPEEVVKIGDYAFYGSKYLINVTIPYSVKYIGKHAFEECAWLRHVNIPSSVEHIGENAYSGYNSIESFNVDENNNFYKAVDGVLCSKDGTILIGYPCKKGDTKFTVPSSVIEIASGAFQHNSTLKEVVISENVIKIGDGAFYNCYFLESVTLPDSLKVIGNNAFTRANLKSITLPKELETIGSEAFSYINTIKSIFIPDKVSYIGKNAFYGGEQLIGINVDGKNKYFSSVDGVLYNKDKTVIIRCPSNYPNETFVIPNTVEKIAYGCFSNVKALKSVIMSNSVKEIDENAFAYCSNLEEIKLSKNIKSIERYTFNYCISLKEIVLPSGLINIEEYAFSYCQTLTTITIPESVKAIDYHAFIYCNDIATVLFDGTKEKWEEVNIKSGNNDLLKANIIFLK